MKGVECECKRRTYRPEPGGARRSRGGSARGLRPAPPATFLDSVPDARERHGRGGCSSGGLSALAAGTPSGGTLAPGLPLGRGHPPLHRPAALCQDAARGICRALAAGTVAHRADTRRGRHRRVPLDGLPRDAREPQPHRAGDLLAARGLRLRLLRDLTPRGQERGELPPDSAPGSAVRRGPASRARRSRRNV